MEPGLALGKTTSFQRFKVEISADFFNIFNHVNFFDTNEHQHRRILAVSAPNIPAQSDAGQR